MMTIYHEVFLLVDDQCFHSASYATSDLDPHVLGRKDEFTSRVIPAGKWLKTLIMVHWGVLLLC